MHDPCLSGPGFLARVTASFAIRGMPISRISIESRDFEYAATGGANLYFSFRWEPKGENGESISFAMCPAQGVIWDSGDKKALSRFFRKGLPAVKPDLSGGIPLTGHRGEHTASQGGIGLYGPACRRGHQGSAGDARVCQGEMFEGAS